MTLRLRSLLPFWSTIAPLWMEEPAPLGIQQDLLGLIKEELTERFGARFKPRQHIAPGQKVWAVRSGWEQGEMADSQDNHQLDLLPWAPCLDPRTHDAFTSLEWEAYGRVLVIVDAVYALGGLQGGIERLTLEQEEPFALAGFWRPSKTGESDVVELLYTEGGAVGFESEVLAPLMLPKHAWQSWLEPWQTQASLTTMLRDLPQPPVQIVSLAKMPYDPPANEDSRQLDLVRLLEDALHTKASESGQLMLFGAA